MAYRRGDEGPMATAGAMLLGSLCIYVTKALKKPED